MAAEMKRLFEGKWTVDRSDNFEAYLDKMGVGMIKKKLATTVSPTLTVSVEGETITTAMSAGPKTSKNSFKLGDQFETDGEVEGTAIASFENGKWTMILTPKKNKDQTLTVAREIINDEIMQTMSFDGVTCKRYFKRA